MRSDTSHTQAPGQDRVLLLGGGELGRELVRSARRLGMYVIVADRYHGSPAAQLADASHVLDMTDGAALAALIEAAHPTLIIPEIEAIAVEVLFDAEARGVQVVPGARAVAICMNRRALRTLASTSLGFLTSRHAFARDAEELLAHFRVFDSRCHVKPLQSSSGKGQRTLARDATREEVIAAWHHAHAHTYREHEEVMIEAHVPFEQEITLLTLATQHGVSWCAPIGHTQRQGDYVLSWQPADVTPSQLAAMQEMSRHLVMELGGYGIFGVEFFLDGEDVYFSEASPRPHDTGFVTLVTQAESEFDAHLLAATHRMEVAPLCEGPGASGAIIATQHYKNPTCSIREGANLEGVNVHIFGKPDASPGRRMGVLVTRAPDISSARNLITQAQQAIDIKDK